MELILNRKHGHALSILSTYNHPGGCDDQALKVVTIRANEHFVVITV